MEPRRWFDERIHIGNIRSLIDRFDHVDPAKLRCLHLNVPFLEDLGALWRHHEHRPLVQELFQVLCRREGVDSLHLEPSIFRPDDAVEELCFYDHLGKALGQLQTLGAVWVRIESSQDSTQAVANLLRHLDHCQSLNIELIPGSDGRDAGFEVLRSVLADKTRIEFLQFAILSGHRPSHADSVAFGNLLEIATSLPSVKMLEFHRGLDDINVSALPPLLHIPSLRALSLHDQGCLSYEGAAAVGTAIAESQIERLTIMDCECFTLEATHPSAATRVYGAVPPLAMALRAPCLEELVVSGLTLPSRRSSLAFADALSRCRLERLDLSGVEWYEEASTEVAMAVCGSTLWELELACDGSVTAEVGKFLRRCQHLERLRAMWTLMDCGALEEFMADCSLCGELEVLEFPYCRSWTTRLDEAMAKCLAQLSQLTSLAIQIVPMADAASIEEKFTASASLAACRVHPALETVNFYGKDHLWCPQFRGELARVLERNKETHDYRTLFLPPVEGGAWTRGQVARALWKVEDKPHVLYLGVTCWIAHFL